MAHGRSLVGRPLTRILALSLLAISACHIIYPAIEDVAPLAPLTPQAVLSVAHRGNTSSGELPDNSIPALRAAIAGGVPLLEVDVRRSSEGDLFLFHDGSLHDGNSFAPASFLRRSIQELTRMERAQVFLDQDRTIPIPTLDEALTLIEKTRSALQLDLKGESDSLALDVLRLVERRGLMHQVVVQIKSPQRIELLFRIFFKVRVLARCTSGEQLDAALRNPIEFVELEKWITSEAIRKAHAKGVLVAVNVAESRFDTPHAWNYLRGRGVDVIMSDSAEQCNAAAQKSPVP